LLTLRGLAMTSVAYITALTIGIFAVTTMSSNAAVQYIQTPIPAHKYELIATIEQSPLEKFKGVRKLAQDELIDVLRAVGFKGQALKLAWAVAMRESNGRPIAHNDNVRTGDNSYGIFQVNMIGSLGVDRREKFNLAANTDLFDPVTNAKIAFHMTKGGTDWGSWGLGPNAYDGSAEEPSITKWLPLFPKS
jgi:hypothetical protein